MTFDLPWRETDMNIPESTVVLVNNLLQQVPELDGVYQTHLDDYAELLPHVFFGDVTRYVVGEVLSHANGSPPQVARILNCLERSMAFGDDAVQELICVSFLENLAEYGEVTSRLKALVGPNLGRELDRNQG